MKLAIKENSLYDATGMGSALLDITVSVDAALLDELGFQKGSMHLIDEKSSKAVLKRLDGFDLAFSPGGSAANAIAGVTNLGGSALLLGAVGSDDYGRAYISETERTGVKTRVGVYDGLSGHAVTFITPDGERTFATHLGAALKFSQDNVTKQDIASSKVLHIEAYLFEIDELYETCLKAIKFAKDSGTLVSIDLSDGLLVERIHDRMKQTIEEYADIVFANEDEAFCFTGKREAFALEELARFCRFAIVKLGERGSLIKTDGRVYEIDAVKTNIVNTNGAGDIYAGGIIYGLTHGLDAQKSGDIASAAASLIVSSEKARFDEKIDALSLVK
ncbi:MAG: adenosine kinase [Leptospirales bacterium]|nr:adenosine kinase [Leptospirales bacterium]